MTAQVIAAKTRTTGPILDPLEKPSIRQALNGIDLDPLEVHKTGRLTAEIKRLLQGLLETDTFSVKVTGESTDSRGSYVSDTLPFSSPAIRTLFLEPKLTAFNLGKTIEVEYTVNRTGETSVTSGKLELNVLDVKPEDLKAGVIFGKNDDGTGHVLDLTTDTDDRTGQVDIWPLIAEGQWFWIKLKGKNADGTDFEKDLYKGKVDTDWITRGYIEVPVFYSELKELLDGSDLTLTYKVAFDQVDDESKANLSEVRSYTVKAAAVVKPAIGEVKDSDGTAISNPDTTSKTPLTLTGTVAEGKKLDIYDGANRLDEVTVTGTTWTFTTVELSPGEHVFTVKEQGAGGQQSEPWTVTVEAVAVKPAIGEVKDSDGTAISNPDTTSKTPLTLTGTVAEGKRLDIYDGANRLDEVTVTGTTWTFTTVELSPGDHVFTVKEQGAGGQQSEPWTVTVEAVAVKPAIGEVKDSDGTAISNPDTTSKTPLTLTGTVAEGKKLDIYDGANRLDEVTVTGTTWTFTTVELSPGDHVFTVKEQGAGGQQSEPWTVTVQPVQTESPVIESAQDSSNNDVPHESITEATVLDLTIKAGKLEQLRILLNGVPGDQAATNGDGVLYYQLEGLRPGDQNITVKGIVSGLESQIYNVFVVPGPSDGKLVIIAAKDAQGKPVLPAGAITTTKITFTGTAQPSATVTLSDVFDELKTVVADLNGYWRLTLIGLNVHNYHLSLSAENAESPMLWGLAVLAVGTPVIELATDLAGTTIIPPYGETPGQAFTLSGVGPANGMLTLHELLSDVEITVNADAQGKWTSAIHIGPELREFHYVASAPGEGSPKSNLYRVRKVEPAK